MDYKIQLGVQLDTSDIQTQINQAGENAKPIELNVETKELTKSIQEALKALSNGTKNALTLNTDSLEASLKDVATTIKEIKTSLGTLDSKSGMKSLLSSINQISSALEKASNQFEGLNKNLNALSGKDLNLNFGINLGGSNSVARNTVYGNKVRSETLPELKKQAAALENYLKEYYKVQEGLQAVLKMASPNKTGINSFVGKDDFANYNKVLDAYNAMSDTKSLAKQMEGYKQYIAVIKEAANLNGIDLSGITSQFSKSAEQLVQDAVDVQTGAKEMEDSFEKLKQVFGGGNNLNIEGISAQLDSIVVDLGEIKTAIQSLSSGVSLDGLIQSFDRLSETIEKLVSNVTLAKNSLGDSSVDVVERASNESTNTVIKNEERKQQAYRETKRLISDSAQKAIDSVSSQSIDNAFRVDESDSIRFRQEMEKLVSEWTNAKGKLTDVKIDTITVYDQDTERNIEKIRQAQVTYNNELGETIKKTIAWRQIGTDVKKVGDKEVSTPLHGFVEVSGQYSKTLGKTKVQTDNFVKQQKQAVANFTNQINQLNRAANDQNAARPIKNSSHLDTLKSKYNEITSAIQRMESASSDTFVDEQNNVKALISDFKSLVSEYRNAENVSSKMKGTDFASGLDIAKNDLEKFKAQAKDFPQITNTIRELDEAIEGVGDAASLNKFNDQLRVARSELAKIKSETSSTNRNEKVGINVSGLQSKIAELQKISPEIDKFETEINGAKVTVQSLLGDLNRVNTQSDFSVVNSKWKAFTDAAKAAGIAITETVTKAKSVSDIKIKLEDTGFNGFEQEVQRAHIEAEKLEGSTAELEAALRKLDAAMEAVYSADQSGDIKRLVAANEEYEASLKQVYSQLKLNQQAEKNAFNAEMLQQKKASLSSEMEIWLKENTRATKDFGEEIRRLQASLDGLDDRGVKLVGQQFKNITKQAQVMGKTGLTVFDKLKAKAKEYMTYLSAAELFMYAEQAFRSMFNAVKEIDTAMTGLYRVTDLTAAEYDTLFDNMIGSAKEYGATLNDIINATTDWVRAGFEADTALGLAEVTTMYQHISDLDYDTAAENLITAYNGFKDELNGAFDGDQVAAVEYIADILNELDNNFAVTSAGLGEALKRSASALDLAGNSIQETAGMITGIAEVTQDPEKAGNALKVLSLRLRGKRIMPPYKESLYALFGLKYNSNIEDNYICQNARVA